jgi:hypothetical protein
VVAERILVLLPGEGRELVIKLVNYYQCRTPNPPTVMYGKINSTAIQHENLNENFLKNGFPFRAAYVRMIKLVVVIQALGRTGP